ncbi:MAG: formylglycine-generating enzyme family protein [Treponema sp.]|nr:formylglycine-generating enzyme family protein [Treponema sp.]
MATASFSIDIKNGVRILSVIALAAITGFSLPGCDTGGPTSGNGGSNWRDLSPPPVEMVRVGSGVFCLGREEGTAGFGNVTPISHVTMSGFYIGRFPVTQGQWYAVMGTWPSLFTGTNNSGGTTVTPSLNRNNLPVEGVNWYEAIVFSNRLSILKGLTPAYKLPNQWPNPTSWSTNPDTWGVVPNLGTPQQARWNAVRTVSGSTGYRLPTEAQWEFAAKGGPLSGAYTFSGSNDINAVAWHLGNSGDRTREVGGLQANQLGIHDFSGNVWEWVWDWHGPYTAAGKTDPSGAPSGSLRIRRGGGWGNSVYGVRSVVRGGGDPAGRYGDLGFRVARPPPRVSHAFPLRPGRGGYTV